MRVVVVGGTGLVGARLVSLLRARGDQAVAASPRTGVDARTGAGLAETLTGADAVVDVSGSPVLAEAGAFFRAVAGNVARDAAAAGVGRSVLLSIVGVDRVPANPYFAAKLAQERVALTGPVPTTVLRATQFHEFADTVAAQLGAGGRVGVAPVEVQPVAVDDVAAALADLVTGPHRERAEIAGPERMGADVWVRRVLTAAGDARRVVTDPAGDPFGTGGASGLVVPADDPGAGVLRLTGGTTLATWLGARAL
jgi:uncharacterized protein YbjT (DUF2867 family)